jgi:hypothetical protein
MMAQGFQMRFVLKNKNTGRYLLRAGLWSTQMDEAMTFTDMTEVREYCQAHRLDNVQPIRRLMPYLMSLMRGTRQSASSEA